MYTHMQNIPKLRHIHMQNIAKLMHIYMQNIAELFNNMKLQSEKDYSNLIIHFP